MRNRLEVAKTLLDRNGTMFVFCDDNEQAYLRVLCDELFGRKSFIATVVWKHSDNSNNDAKKFSTDHNYILVYPTTKVGRALSLNVVTQMPVISATQTMTLVALGLTATLSTLPIHGRI